MRLLLPLLYQSIVLVTRYHPSLLVFPSGRSFLHRSKTYLHLVAYSHPTLAGGARLSKMRFSCSAYPSKIQVTGATKGASPCKDGEVRRARRLLDPSRRSPRHTSPRCCLRDRTISRFHA